MNAHTASSVSLVSSQGSRGLLCPICGTPSLYRQRRARPSGVRDEAIFVCFRCHLSFEPRAWRLDGAVDEFETRQRTEREALLRRIAEADDRYGPARGFEPRRGEA